MVTCTQCGQKSLVSDGFGTFNIAEKSCTVTFPACGGAIEIDALHFRYLKVQM